MGFDGHPFRLTSNSGEQDIPKTREESIWEGKWCHFCSATLEGPYFFIAKERPTLTSSLVRKGSQQKLTLYRTGSLMGETLSTKECILSVPSQLLPCKNRLTQGCVSRRWDFRGSANHLAESLDFQSYCGTNPTQLGNHLLLVFTVFTGKSNHSRVS